MAYPDLELHGKTAVVIGGTSGIGRAIALGLAAAGADVVASGRRDQHVSEVTREIQALGRRSLGVTVDVSSRSSTERLLAAVLHEFGKVDILVNSAGQIKREPTLQPEEPRDGSWGERYFHMYDPDGRELSFARPLR